ncbi:MAG: hypothetical protein KBF72_02325 [Candidatus Syntrophosphaera sp.]|nr:hypothetical protein [Candidatus Syntrophosphaera sp.]OQB07313.1 MAG: hypothetical protein BWY18_00457 [Candidatus Cloacimonetes bacterium ADurb.Bin211]
MLNNEERPHFDWHTPHKKTYDWKRLIIMVVLLVAILIAINRLNKMSTVTEKPAAEFIESDTLNPGINPLPHTSK